MSSWTAQRVLDAAAAMEWVPEGAIELRTDDYRLIRYPDVVLDPTVRAAQVTWSRTARALEDILDEVAVRIRAWDLAGVAWWVSAATRPADTEQALCARGAELIDAVQVLAREIGGSVPQLDVRRRWWSSWSVTSARSARPRRSPSRAGNEPSRTRSSWPVSSTRPSVTSRPGPASGSWPSSVASPSRADRRSLSSAAVRRVARSLT